MPIVTTYDVPRRPLGTTGLEVSAIGLGALEIGRDWAADVDPSPHHLSEAEAISFVHAALDLGINFIDTAPAYWHSEEYLGKALKGRRENVILATKVGEHCDPTGSYYDYSYQATLRFVDQSLRRLQTDYLDLVQIHSAPMEVLEKGETYAALLKAKEQGKIVHIGMTGGARECARALELGSYATVQVPYNLLNLAAEELVFPLARKRNAGVLIMRALAGGKLTRKFANLSNEDLKLKIRGFEKFLMQTTLSLAQLALGYVLAARDVTCVLVGARNIEHLEEAIMVAKNPLSQELVDELGRYARSIEANVW